jgi:hypothetical protein
LADGPIAVVGKLHFVNQCSGGVLQAQVMPNGAGPTGNEVEDSGIFIRESGSIGGDNDVRTRAEDGIGREGELDAFGETLTGNVCGNIVGISQFDVAFEQIAGNGMVHDLIY